MTATFPVIHSILDAEALSQAVAAQYGLDPLSCQLVSRGSNDIYHLRTADRDYAIRVLRAGWRTDAQLGYEIDWVTHLEHCGISVVPPIASPAGDRYFSVPAPEGVRPILLSQWLTGRAMAPPISPSDAETVGGILARIHQAGDSFETANPRPIDTMGKILANREALGRLLSHRRDDQRFFDAALDWLDTRLLDVPKNLPRAHTHGDLHFGNVFVEKEKRLVLLDFDDCGEDWAIKDLLPFLWRNGGRGPGPPPSASDFSVATSPCGV